MYNMIYNNPEERARISYSYVTWNGAFSSEEIDRIVEYCDSQGTELGTTFSSDNESVKNVRDSNVKFHHPNEDTSWIFHRLNDVIYSANQQFYNFNLNGYAYFQYTTYDKDGRYDWHSDMAYGNNERDKNIQPRKLSLSLLLNDDFEGGEFQINTGKESEPTIVDLKKGQIVLFPSFILHRVTPITQGTRKSLVVWTLGPKFI